MRRAVINNYEFARRRWKDHGPVYADYYFLLVVDKICEMGLAKGGCAAFMPSEKG